MEYDDGAVARVEFVRVRINWDVAIPLCFQRHFQFEIGVNTLLRLRFERLRGFCEVCGMLTHDSGACLIQNGGGAHGGDDDGVDDDDFSPAVHRNHGVVIREIQDDEEMDDENHDAAAQAAIEQNGNHVDLMADDPDVNNGDHLPPAYQRIQGVRLEEIHDDAVHDAEAEAAIIQNENYVELMADDPDGYAFAHLDGGLTRDFLAVDEPEEDEDSAGDENEDIDPDHNILEGYSSLSSDDDAPALIYPSFVNRGAVPVSSGAISPSNAIVIRDREDIRNNDDVQRVSPSMSQAGVDNGKRKRETEDLAGPSSQKVQACAEKEGSGSGSRGTKPVRGAVGPKPPSAP